MKSLISRVMYHPFIARSSFYLTDLMCNVDYSLSGALLLLVSESMSRLLSLLPALNRTRQDAAKARMAITACKSSDRMGSSI
jgi:hypothetical protein